MFSDDKVKILMSGLKNYDTEKVLEVLFEIMMDSFLVVMAKDNKYNGSWQKRGLLSISQNVERKWDRIEEMLFSFNLDKMGFGENSNESLLDSLMDEAMYCLLALSFFKLKSFEDDEVGLLVRPVWKKFVEMQQSYIDDLDKEIHKGIPRIDFDKKSGSPIIDREHIYDILTKEK